LFSSPKNKNAPRLVATALARLTGMLVAVQTASLRRYDPDQVLRVASLSNEALSKLTPLADCQAINELAAHSLQP
jgi:hypothetical protein